MSCGLCLVSELISHAPFSCAKCRQRLQAEQGSRPQSMHGTGAATGSHSVPHKFWRYGVVTAQVDSPLPDLTVLLPGYGTCVVVWAPVQCLLDTPYFQYTIGESAAGTFLMQVTNARCAAAAAADLSFPAKLCLPHVSALLQQRSGV